MARKMGSPVGIIVRQQEAHRAQDNPPGRLDDHRYGVTQLPTKLQDVKDFQGKAVPLRGTQSCSR